MEPDQAEGAANEFDYFRWWCTDARNDIASDVIAASPWWAIRAISRSIIACPHSVTVPNWMPSLIAEVRRHEVQRDDAARACSGDRRPRRRRFGGQYVIGETDIALAQGPCRRNQRHGPPHPSGRRRLKADGGAAEAQASVRLFMIPGQNHDPKGVDPFSLPPTSCPRPASRKPLRT